MRDNDLDIIHDNDCPYINEFDVFNDDDCPYINEFDVFNDDDDDECACIDDLDIGATGRPAENRRRRSSPSGGHDQLIDRRSWG